MAPTFHIIHLGCKVNKVEADTMAARLLAAGATRTAPEDASVVLVNTCTVTAEADAKSRKAAHHAAREAPHAKVIVCGCGAVTNARQFESDLEGLYQGWPGRGMPRIEVIPQKDAALARAGELLGLTLSRDTAATLVRVGEGFNARVPIKVQDGCDHACSYCIVPLARGRAQSLPLAQALEQIAAHAQAGASEVILTGIDLGSYQDGAYGLEHLLSRALEAADGFRLRLSSIELPSITDGLIQLIAASEGRVCAHLHIPLQSGSDPVLRAMGRRYDVATYRERIAAIKEALPRIALATDVIVGFPDETDKDFERTLLLCRELGFFRIHIFPYSRRPGTSAAKLLRQIPPELKTERANTLRALAVQLKREDVLRRVGTREAVVYERPHQGRSESDYPVQLAQDTRHGDLVTMEITGYEHGMLTVSE
ncbi:MAG: MiaB/RimO family radical SAM methylthiotransferase [Coriobacteriales bacterium]|jgi:threonylcarbamoyladenosine tRNA methylthiotransferase MtaB|nr:MiaB/RimO family radical SAM methylthiotransferase [Coriobacteriales bacterium]